MTLREMELQELNANLASMRLREGLTKGEIKQMQDDKTCPTCGKKLTASEIEHLAGGKGNTKSSESRRSDFLDSIELELPGGGALNLREAAATQAAAHATAHEAAAKRQEEADIAVFESLGLPKNAAKFAAQEREFRG